MTDEELARWMGGVDVKLAGLEARSAEDRDLATQHRADLRLELRALGVGVAEVMTTVKALAPNVHESISHVQQAIGAARFGDILTKMAPIAAGTVGAAFMWILQYLSTAFKPH